MYGYCLEPYPQFQSRYQKEKTGKVCAKNTALNNGTCDPSCTANGNDYGPCVYKSYSRACLLWNPITLSNQPESGAAAASLGVPVYSYNSAGNISYCVTQSNPTFDANLIEKDPNDDIGVADPDNTADYTREHWLYENDDPNIPGCSYKSECQTRTSEGYFQNVNSTLVTQDIDEGAFESNNNSTEGKMYLATEFAGDFWGRVLVGAGGGCVAYGTVGAIGGAAAGGIGALPGGVGGCVLGTAVGGVTGAVTALFGWGAQDDTTMFVPMSGKEMVGGKGLSFDAIDKIEYSIVGAERNEFRELFNTGNTHSVNNFAETYYPRSMNVGRNVIRAGDPKGAIGFYHDDKDEDRCGQPGAASLCDKSADDFFTTSCSAYGAGFGQDIVAIRPTNKDNRLIGWDWRYCDKGGGGKKIVAVNIKISFKKINTTVHRMAQNEFINYCTAFVKPIGSNGENVGKYRISKAQVEPDTTPDNLGTHGTYLTLGGKKFLTSLDSTQRVSLKAQRKKWEADEFYTQTGTNYLQTYPETKTHAVGWEKLKPTGAGSTPVKAGFQYKSFIKPKQDTAKDIPVYPLLPDESVENLRTGLFAKAYEMWRWVSGKYEQTAKWDGSKYVAVGGPTSPDDRDTLQDMWDKSRTEAQGRAPVTSPAVPVGGKYTKGASGGFYFEHDSLLYPKVNISFWINADNDQLPLRKIIVDWGDGVKRRLSYTDSNPEGTGKNEREGPAIGVATDDLPFEFSHIYGDGNPKGKHICLYTMDNWEAKAATCGTVSKDAGIWSIKDPTDWKYKFDLATFPLSTDASRTWPEGDVTDPAFTRKKYGLE